MSTDDVGVAVAQETHEPLEELMTEAVEEGADVADLLLRVGNEGEGPC